MTARTQLAIAGIVMAIAGLAFVGTLDAQEADHNQQLYCEMVELHHDTNGRHGWPPYNGDCP